MVVDKSTEMTTRERCRGRVRARRIHAQENQAKAVELRKRGMTYSAIAQQLGISAQAVYKAVKKAMDQLKAQVYIDIGTIRTMELEKLDAVELGMWPGVSKGNHNAGNTIIKVIETRAKMLGLNAPERHVNTHGQGEDHTISRRIRDMSDEELQARIKVLREDLGNDGLIDP